MSHEFVLSSLEGLNCICKNCFSFLIIAIELLVGLSASEAAVKVSGLCAGAGLSCGNLPWEFHVLHGGLRG